MASTNEIIEMVFPIDGDLWSSDAGYHLYAAISQLIPEVHDADWPLGIHSIKGRKLEPGCIRLGRSSQLRLRLPISKVDTLFPLAGAWLEVNGHKIRCGLPRLERLTPSETLRSRLIIVKTKGLTKNGLEPDAFLACIKRQLSELNVHAEPEIELDPNDVSRPARRVLRIKDTTLTGYGVIVRNLEPSQSLLLQQKGLGGRRRMGCGLFVPIRGQ